MSGNGIAACAPRRAVPPPHAAAPAARILRSALAETAAGRASAEQLRRLLAIRLGARFIVRCNDPVVSLPIAQWRMIGTPLTRPARNMNCIDLGLYRGGRLCGLVAVVAHLDDLRPCGLSSRAGHRDVYSLACSAAGAPFLSCQALEKLAVAAFAHAVRQAGHRPVNEEHLREALLRLRSDSPAAHNPAALPLFLVAARCHHGDARLLAPRLRSLGARLLAVRVVGRA